MIAYGVNHAPDIMFAAIFLTMELLPLQMHCESGGGQFELAVGHFPCLEAADKLLLLREAVTAIAHKHQLRATFLPK